MWFPLAPQSLDFADRSPYQLRFDTAIYAPPERVFDVFVGDDMGAWLRDLVEMRWTNELRGLGATRVVKLDKGLAVKERFIAWERGRHVAFTIEAITVPVVRAMIEDLRLEPLSSRHTRARYTVHYAPHPAVRPIHAVARRFFGEMFHDAMRGLARVSMQ